MVVFDGVSEVIVVSFSDTFSGMTIKKTDDYTEEFMTGMRSQI